jgi:hypothetical protein
MLYALDVPSLRKVNWLKLTPYRSFIRMGTVVKIGKDDFELNSFLKTGHALTSELLSTIISLEMCLPAAGRTTTIRVLDHSIGSPSRLSQV